MHLFMRFDEESRIMHGYWMSVVVNGSLIFAALNDPSEVYVFEYFNLKWTKVRSFETIGTPGDISTIVISNDNIVYCSVTTNEYYFYSVLGKPKSMFYGPGGDNAGKTTQRSHYPHVCASDAAGSVLITETVEYGLQVMSKNGEFNNLQLHPNIRTPRRAVLHKNNLFMISYLDKKLFKYN